jgi:hypothetical protein
LSLLRSPFQTILGEDISLHELRVDSQLDLATFVLRQLESVEVLLFSFFVLLFYVHVKPLVIPGDFEVSDAFSVFLCPYFLRGRTYASLNRDFNGALNSMVVRAEIMAF